MSELALPIDLSKPGLRERLGRAEFKDGMRIEIEEALDHPGAVTEVRITTDRMSLERERIDELIDLLLGPIAPNEKPFVAYWCLPIRSGLLVRSGAEIWFRYVDDTDRYLLSVTIKPNAGK